MLNFKNILGRKYCKFSLLEIYFSRLEQHILLSLSYISATSDNSCSNWHDIYRIKVRKLSSVGHKDMSNRSSSDIML